MPLGVRFVRIINMDTEEVMKALRGEILPRTVHVEFLEYAAKDAEDYGDYDLARENREDADRLRSLIS